MPKVFWKRYVLRWDLKEDREAAVWIWAGRSFQASGGSQREEAGSLLGEQKILRQQRTESHGHRHDGK